MFKKSLKVKHPKSTKIYSKKTNKNKSLKRHQKAKKPKKSKKHKNLKKSKKGGTGQGTSGPSEPGEGFYSPFVAKGATEQPIYDEVGPPVEKRVTTLEGKVRELEQRINLLRVPQVSKVSNL